jgi:hypothetical protein
MQFTPKISCTEKGTCVGFRGPSLFLVARSLENTMADFFILASFFGFIVGIVLIFAQLKLFSIHKTLLQILAEMRTQTSLLRGAEFQKRLSDRS